MQKAKPRFTIALMFSAYAVLAFFGTAFLAGGIDFLYRDAAGLSTVRGVAQVAALLAAAALILTGLIITISTALRPARWYRKVLYAVPLFLLGMTLAAIASALMGVGVTGTFVNVSGFGSLTFAVTWLAVSAVAATVAGLIAAARLKAGARVLKASMITTAITGVLSVIAAIAMVASVVIVATSQPSSTGFRDSGGQTGQPPPSGSFGGGREGGFGGEGRRPGGEFGGFANAASTYEVGGGVMAVFAVLALGGLGAGWLALRRRTPDTEAEGTEVQVQTAPLHVRHEAGLAVLSCIGLGLILVGGASLLVPVSHDNPPVQSTINWDSTETQSLFQRACADCHSNETIWPWYSYVAPASWITEIHVMEGRARLNLSVLSRRGEGANEMVQQIRNGTMPPADYLLMHPDAQLTDAEKQQLIQGLEKTLGG